MGLFALPEDDSPGAQVRAAIANLKLWQDWRQPDYLLNTFALGCVLRAMGLSTEQIHEVHALIRSFRGEEDLEEIEDSEEDDDEDTGV